VGLWAAAAGAPKIVQVDVAIATSRHDNIGMRRGVARSAGVQQRDRLDGGCVAEERRYLVGATATQVVDPDSLVS
jgi:hypothetical protein